MDIGSHVFDLFEYVLGGIDQIIVLRFECRKDGVDERVDLNVRFENGATGRASLAWVTNNPRQEISFRSEPTFITWKRNGGGADILGVQNSNGYLESELDVAVEYREMFDQFAKASVGRPNSLPTYASGMRNLYVISTAYQSAYLGRSVPLARSSP